MKQSVYVHSTCEYVFQNKKYARVETPKIWKYRLSLNEKCKNQKISEREIEIMIFQSFSRHLSSKVCLKFMRKYRWRFSFLAILHLLINQGNLANSLQIAIKLLSLLQTLSMNHQLNSKYSHAKGFSHYGKNLTNYKYLKTWFLFAELSFVFCPYTYRMGEALSLSCLKT